MTDSILDDVKKGFFGRLREAAGHDWTNYVSHPFVQGLARGDLPGAAFRHYLEQDYLFLIQFARAYALAAYKSEALDDMRQAGSSMMSIIDHEMQLHVDYCKDWGLTEAGMAALPEAMETVAYTRYVIDVGMRGDRLDLEVALAPCIVGYAEIAARLMAKPSTRLDGNPYRAWLDNYACASYEALARTTIDKINIMAARRGGEARFESLAHTFAAATRLEGAFWQMGLDATRR
ncbi:MAG: thiaminase II [Parvibaculaceae bacterium]|nr:thiaminase II [Parvibaculaceae bacterium]